MVSLLLAAPFLVNPAQAAPVVVSFEASLIGGTCGLDCTGSLGTSLTGTFVYESTSTGSGSNPTTYGLTSLNFTTSFSIDGGASVGSVSIANNVSSPQSDAITVAGGGLSGSATTLVLTYINLQAIDEDATVFSNTNLPTAIPSLSLFETAFLNMTWSDGVTIWRPTWEITTWSTGYVPGGECCEVHSGASCDEVTCASAVCAADSYCCTNQWDAACVSRAATTCSMCGGGSGGTNCPVVGTGPRAALDHQLPTEPPFNGTSLGISYPLNANPLGGSFGLFDVEFDEEAAQSISTAKVYGSSDAIGAYRPDGSATEPFDGSMLAGIWTLSFEDVTGNTNETVLEAWDLNGRVLDEPAILECNITGMTTGGDTASIRGIRFHVDESFQGVRLSMNASSAGAYTFDAELRRDGGFLVGPEVVAPMEVSLPATGVERSFPISFGPVAVSGTETFTLRFSNFSGPGTAYMRTLGIGNTPCPGVEETETSSGSYPAERGDPQNFSVIALAVPEPSAVLGLISGTTLLGWMARRRAKPGESFASLGSRPMTPETTDIRSGRVGQKFNLSD